MVLGTKSLTLYKRDIILDSLRMTFAMWVLKVSLSSIVTPKSVCESVLFMILSLRCSGGRTFNVKGLLVNNI